MKKRGISFALLLAAVFTMLMAFTVFAADLALSSEATTVYKGQKITLSAQYNVVPQIKRNSILHIIRDCFCDVSMNNSRLFDADSALYFI